MKEVICKADWKDIDAETSGLRYGGRGSLRDGSHRRRQQPREFSDLSKATHPGFRKTRFTSQEIPQDTGPAERRHPCRKDTFHIGRRARTSNLGVRNKSQKTAAKWLEFFFK